MTAPMPNQSLTVGAGLPIAFRADTRDPTLLPRRTGRGVLRVKVNKSPLVLQNYGQTGTGASAS